MIKMKIERLKLSVSIAIWISMAFFMAVAAIETFPVSIWGGIILSVLSIILWAATISEIYTKNFRFFSQDVMSPVLDAILIGALIWTFIEKEQTVIAIAAIPMISLQFCYIILKMFSGEYNNIDY